MTIVYTWRKHNHYTYMHELPTYCKLRTASPASHRSTCSHPGSPLLYFCHTLRRLQSALSSHLRLGLVLLYSVPCPALFLQAPLPYEEKQQQHRKRREHCMYKKISHEVCGATDSEVRESSGPR
ncbi:hypothetical protein VPH35_124639 [Triticum aestivum]